MTTQKHEFSTAMKNEWHFLMWVIIHTKFAHVFVLARRASTNSLVSSSSRFSMGRNVCGSSNPFAEVRGTSCGALDLELEAEKEVAHESHLAGRWQARSLRRAVTY